MRLLLFLTFLLSAGCAITRPVASPGATSRNLALVGETNPLVNTSWQLMALGTTEAAIPVLRGNTITLEFGADGRINGRGGCNAYGGLYAVEENLLRLDEIVSTVQSCADYRVTNQEQQYLNALRSAESFARDGDRLGIWYADRKGLLTFTEASAVRPPTATSAVTATPIPPPPTPLSAPLLPTMTVAPPAVVSPLLPTLSMAPFSDGLTLPTTTTPINFAPGTALTEINGTIAEQATNSYLLSAQQSQLVTVTISSPNNDVRLRVIGEDGSVFKEAEDGLFSWTSQLPATQDYLIAAVAVGPTTPYTLRVALEPLSDGDAERLNVAPDAPAVTRSGNLLEASTKAYLLNATVGQTLTVQTVGYNGPVNFTIRSPSGTTWNGALAGSDSNVLAAQAILPETGDYVVTLAVPAGSTTPYDATFTLVGAAVAMTPTPPVPPERVELASGTTPAERTGQLPEGASSKQYVLNANTGQAMIVDVSSSTPITVTIAGPAGISWTAEMNPVGTGYAVNYQLPLAETGDYTITLAKAEQTPVVNYTIRFTLQ